jgi:hypothetical protein
MSFKRMSSAHDISAVELLRLPLMTVCIAVRIENGLMSRIVSAAIVTPREPDEGILDEDAWRASTFNAEPMVICEHRAFPRLVGIRRRSNQLASICCGEIVLLASPVSLTRLIR